MFNCSTDEPDMPLIWHSRFTGIYKKEILKLDEILATGSSAGLTEWSLQLISEERLQVTLETHSMPSFLQTHLTPKSPRTFKDLAQDGIRTPGGICLPHQKHGLKRSPPSHQWSDQQIQLEVTSNTGSLAASTAQIISKVILEEDLFVMVWFARIYYSGFNKVDLFVKCLVGLHKVVNSSISIIWYLNK